MSKTAPIPDPAQLSGLIEDLRQTNHALRQARRAALNMMEDAIESREALRVSEETYRLKLEREVREQTAEIKEQSHYIKRITETVPDMVSVTNLETREFEYLNKETFKAQGFDPAKMKAKSREELDEYIHADDRLAIKSYFEKFLTASDDDVFTAEYRARGDKHAWNWFLVRGRPFQRNEAGAVTHVLNVIENITERKQAQAELMQLKDEATQKATDKYQDLFNSIDEGFGIAEMIFLPAGKVDMKWLELNPQYERLTGLSRSEMLSGKTVREIQPSAEDKWFDTYANVVRTQTSVRFEEHSPTLNRWYDVYAFPVGKPELHEVAIVFQDITLRKRREVNQAMLDDISKDLVWLDDTEETMEQLAKKIAEYFKASWCMFFEISDDKQQATTFYGWHAPEVPSLKGSYRMEDFLTAAQIDRTNNGQQTVITDIQAEKDANQENYDALGVRSFIVTPQARGKDWKFMISVIHNERREWRDDEVALVKEISNRVWARLERARAEAALRTNEERMRVLKEAFQTAVSGKPMAEALHLFAEVIAKETRGEARTAFYMTDASSAHLYTIRGAGDMPEAYADAIDGFVIGDKAIGCALAIRQNRPALASDVFDDPLWQPWAHLAKAFGFRGYWSFPVASHENRVLGTFALHFRTVREPSPSELELIALITQATAVIISSYKASEQRADTQEALRISEARLKATMDSATEYAIITTNTTGIVELWSTGAEKLFGYTQAEMIGHPADIIFTPEDRENNVPAWEMETAASTGAANDERWHVGKDGSRFFVSGVMAPIYDSSLSGYVKVARDITERKLLEQQKDEFIAVASHELKTPVTSIKAYTELLTDILGEEGTEDHVQMVRKLDAQVDRLTDLIRSLLDTTRISEGQLALSMQDFDLNALIQERIDELRRTTDNHRIIFEASGIINITADRERIGQVLINLLSNAIKYSPRGGDIRIAVTQQRNEAVQVSVQDKGVGISAEKKEKIFDRFYRVRNAQIDTFPGMGLGLYISAAIINRHQGKIWVDSKPGKGATFYFLLPARGG